tara:strand:+ start:2276 stop:3499 length:1224 start_codon:yes stop_codon:yes gene_type:complete
MNLAALNSPSFRLYLFGSFIALNGLWIQRIIIGWLAWEISNSPFYVGIAAFLSLAPTIFSGPIFGVLIDRANIKVAFFLSYSAMILCSSILFFLILTDLLTIKSLLLICLFIGIIASAAHPIRMSLAPRLIDESQVPSLVALTAVNFNTSRLIGPAIGGFLIQYLGASGTILISIFTYLPVMVFIMFVKPRDLISDDKNRSLIFDFFEGIKLIFSNSVIKFSIVLSGLTAFVGRGVLETLPLISEGVFSQGPTGLGLITAAAGAGALFSSIAKALGKAEISGTNISNSTLFAALTIPIVVLLIGYANSFLISLFLIFILGFLATTIGISIQSKIQLELKDVFRGRVMSIWIMINMGSAAFGSIIFGLVSDYLSIQMSHTVFGYSFIFLIVFLILFNNISIKTKTAFK